MKSHTKKNDPTEEQPSDLDTMIALIGYLEQDAKQYSAAAAYFLARARGALTEGTGAREIRLVEHPGPRPQ